MAKISNENSDTHLAFVAGKYVYLIIYLYILDVGYWNECIHKYNTSIYVQTVVQLWTCFILMSVCDTCVCLGDQIACCCKLYRIHDHKRHDVSCSCCCVWLLLRGLRCFRWIYVTVTFTYLFGVHAFQPQF